MSGPISLTWFRRVTNPRNGVPIDLYPEELDAQLRDPAAMRGSKKSLAIITPSLFEENYREEAKVIATYWTPLDLDTPTADPAAVLEAVHLALGEVEVYMHSTPSSEPGAFRLRAIVPNESPVSVEVHRLSWSVIRRILGRSGIIIDRSGPDASRACFVWSVPPNGAYWSGSKSGHRWPAELAAAKERARLAHEAASQVCAPVAPPSNALSRARAYVEKMPPAISGAHGHDALWRVARVIVADFALGDDDAMHILREYSARCQPPWSEKELRHKLDQAKRARVRRDMEATR